MNINTEIRVSRLNYEWAHLVKYIKEFDPKMWDSVYDLIQEKLGKLLADNEVSIGSEYSVFDDCIRQVPDLFGELMYSYETIIKNYRTVLGLGIILPMTEIAILLQKYNVKLTEVDNFFRQINADIANEGYMSNTGIYVDGKKYFGFRPTEHNLSLLNVMKIEISGLNSEQFMTDVKEYINIIVMYNIMPLLDRSDESPSSPPQTV
jgi:hypothetical protein